MKSFQLILRLPSFNHPEILFENKKYEGDTCFKLNT